MIGEVIDQPPAAYKIVVVNIPSRLLSFFDLDMQFKTLNYCHSKIVQQFGHAIQPNAKPLAFKANRSVTCIFLRSGFGVLYGDRPIYLRYEENVHDIHLKTRTHSIGTWLEYLREITH